MHELSIVRNLVDKLEKEAISNNAKNITSVTIKFSPFSGFDANDIEFSFNILKKEKHILKEANIVIEKEAGTVKCERCSNKFDVEELPNICPKCDSIQLTPIHQTGLILKSYEIEKE